MDNAKRIYYNIVDASINGVSIRGINSVGMISHFDLECCFCSCAVQMHVHYDDCPNAKQERFIRYLNEDEKNIAFGLVMPR